MMRKRRKYYDLRFVTCAPDGVWPLRVTFWYRMRGGSGPWHEIEKFDSMGGLMGRTDGIGDVMLGRVGGRMWRALRLRLESIGQHLRNFAMRQKILEMSDKAVP